MDDVNQPLRELFDKIDANALGAMKDRREEESLNLDFKRMDPSGEPTADDKKNLREAISGYANAAGGIILWGVESKAPEDRRDRSRFQSLIPLTDGDRAVVRFQELTATATQPPVSGVVHKAIAVAGGFVVKTFVPASDGGPHRTNEEKGQYFRRYADAFRPMQHHEIADMFGRRAQPRLELVTAGMQFNQFFGPGRPRVTTILVGLRNTGRAVARFPKLVIVPTEGTVEPWEYGIDGNGRTGLPRSPRSPGSNDYHFVGSANEVIHPESTLEVSKFGLEPSPGGGVSFEYKIYADVMRFVEGTQKFSADDLKEPPKL